MANDNLRQLLNDYLSKNDKYYREIQRFVRPLDDPTVPTITQADIDRITRLADEVKDAMDRYKEALCGFRRDSIR